MIRSYEEELIMEAANDIVSGDYVDVALNADTDVDPSDFDTQSDEEQILSIVDLLSATEKK